MCSARRLPTRPPDPVNALRHPAVYADTLRRLREAAEATLKTYPESERMEAARFLGLEHYLPDAQDELTLPKTVLGAPNER